jgi:hypothetical protein
MISYSIDTISCSTDQGTNVRADTVAIAGIFKMTISQYINSFKDMMKMPAIVTMYTIALALFAAYCCTDQGAKASTTSRAMTGILK